ncbi:MAG: ABC transporter permease [Aigarchaeota archaeon]|nr:ABC transporter permease [Aigarchaeota archaeon]
MRVESILPLLKPYVLALAVSFGVAGVLMIALGYDPLQSFSVLISAPFTSERGLAETLMKFTPLLLAGFAFAIPLRAGLFNIGGWGQMLVGGTVVGLLGLALRDFYVPSPIFVLLLILAASLAGALWAAVPAVLRTQFGAKEIVTTIMMNFIAVYVVKYVCIIPPWADPVMGHPMTFKIVAEAQLPRLGRFHVGVILVLAIAIATYFFMNRSIPGYEIKAVGANPTASQVFGIHTKRVMFLSLAIGGAMAGIGGAIEVMGVHHRLVDGFALTCGAHYGVYGILTALVALGSFAGLPVAAFLISGLLVGADAMQRTIGVPVELVFIIQALIVVLVVWIKKVRPG